MKLNRRILANAIRILSIDAIQKAQSGHPGAPMGMADIAEVLWRDYLNHNPRNPNWMNRDRFVLSNGHASMLLYSLLHLTGYDMSIEDIKDFRKFDSKTPGHPEMSHSNGIEITTGPLGQGIANAVGFAIGEKVLSAQFNRPQFNIIDHYIYVFAGDGCMMEGISHEACSLAGRLQLNKLILFYDANGISIDGNVKDWFSENVSARFKSYNWNVISDIDGHNSKEIKLAIDLARKSNKPNLLICKTIIGFGSPNKSGTSSIHGSPLGEEEIYAVRKQLNWKEKPFFIPKDIYYLWNAQESGEKKETEWKKKVSKYRKTYPDLFQELKRRENNQLPKEWKEVNSSLIEELQKSQENTSTRKASQKVLNTFGPILPEFIGGSADLSPSTLVKWSKSVSITKKDYGNYIYYGAREFGMTAIANGISSYKCFIPYTSTFLVFSDYACNAIRMAALMKIRHIMIYTHDSIGLGEDGPTHQPIEHLAHLRMIPNLSVWRPCDQIETTIAWRKAIERKKGPTVLVLSRQDLQKQNRTDEQIKNIYKGGYILKECSNIFEKPELILISTGSEIHLAVLSHQKLSEKGYNVRVVSLPSVDAFEKQKKSYKDHVLPKRVKKLIIEASIKDYWYKYLIESKNCCDCNIIGMESFGKSASSRKLFDFFGFTVENILNTSYKILNEETND